MAESGAGGARPAVLEEAISWVVRLQSGACGSETREACRRWREADAEHERVWRQLQIIENDLRTINDPAAANALRAAPRASRRRALAALLGVGVAGGAAWVGAREDGWSGFAADYSTTVGERRHYALAHGATLWLNTDSAVDVQGVAGLRLLSGELCLDTGPRAWEVRTGQGCFRARDARFVLRQLPGATALCVQRGTLEVEPRRGPAAIAVAGRRYLVADTGIHAAPDHALDMSGWTDGLLTARNMPLDAFLAELARYQRGWLRCGPGVAALRVSGVFLLDDLPAALDTLARSLPVRIERATRWWTRVVRI